ncbi:MAG: hypothetical protein JST32_18070 [Bacteroidetes bacterium]|nr:hypothetical protein [Bacteroidota bacterium]
MMYTWFRLTVMQTEIGNFPSFGGLLWISGRYIQNFEIETAAIYGLAALLGHRPLPSASSCATQASSAHPDKAIDRHIGRLVERIAGMF